MKRFFEKLTNDLSTTLSLAQEFQGFIQRTQGPFLEVLFSGSVFRHKRLRTGAIWELRSTSQPANDHESEQRMSQAKEKVFLLKFLSQKKLSFSSKARTPDIKELRDDSQPGFTAPDDSNPNFEHEELGNIHDLNSSDHPNLIPAEMKQALEHSELESKNENIDPNLREGVDEKEGVDSEDLKFSEESWDFIPDLNDSITSSEESWTFLPDAVNSNNISEDNSSLGSEMIETTVPPPPLKFFKNDCSCVLQVNSQFLVFFFHIDLILKRF